MIKVTVPLVVWFTLAGCSSPSSEPTATSLITTLAPLGTFETSVQTQPLLESEISERETAMPSDQVSPEQFAAALPDLQLSPLDRSLSEGRIDPVPTEPANEVVLNDPHTCTSQSTSLPLDPISTTVASAPRESEDLAAVNLQAPPPIDLGILPYKPKTVVEFVNNTHIGLSCATLSSPQGHSGVGVRFLPAVGGGNNIKTVGATHDFSQYDPHKLTITVRHDKVLNPTIKTSTLSGPQLYTWTLIDLETRKLTQQPPVNLFKVTVILSGAGRPR